MGIKDRLYKKITQLKTDAQEGARIIEQERAEKLRQKRKRYTEPGTISYGLLYRQDVITFTNDAINRRKCKRMLKNESNRKSKHPSNEGR
jgi:hypothetical protein